MNKEKEEEIIVSCLNNVTPKSTSIMLNISLQKVYSIMRKHDLECKLKTYYGTHPKKRKI